MSESYAQIARGHMIAAGHVESAGNIASGYGEYGLANRCWAFAEGLRRKADWWRAGARGDGLQYGVRIGELPVTACHDRAHADDLAAMTKGDLVSRDAHLLTAWTPAG